MKPPPGDRPWWLYAIAAVVVAPRGPGYGYADTSNTIVRYGVPVVLAALALVLATYAVRGWTTRRLRTTRRQHR